MEDFKCGGEVIAWYFDDDFAGFGVRACKDGSADVFDFFVDFFTCACCCSCKEHAVGEVAKAGKGSVCCDAAFDEEVDCDHARVVVFFEKDGHVVCKDVFAAGGCVFFKGHVRTRGKQEE